MNFRVALAVLLLTVLATPAPVGAWSARKTAVHARQRPHRERRSTATAKPQHAVALHDRVTDLLTRGPRIAPAEALVLLKQAATAREMGDAVALAEAIAAAPHASVAQLVDAATTLSQSHDYPVQRRLWQRAFDAGRKHPALGRTVAEGQADALLAAGDKRGALKVLDAALGRAAPGTRRSLLERLVVLGRQDGDLRATADLLRNWRDPDAAALRAQLLEEAGDDDNALADLRHAWKTYAGNRSLQAAYINTLKRLGLRDELRTIVAQVVRLAPADPQPWLIVLDSQIAARDTVAARALSDDLARRHPRNAAFLEALIDREQRLGGDPKRMTDFYEALLKASPDDAQPIEAYAEWLMGRAEEQRAMAVLARLHRLSAGEAQGLEMLHRQAAFLLEHGRPAPARVAAQALLERKPDDPKALRLLAMIDAREGKLVDAEQRWLSLIALGDRPTGQERARAAEGRQALVALYRKMSLQRQRLQALEAQVHGPVQRLGTALLFLELSAQIEDAVMRLPDAVWLHAAAVLHAKFPMDPEVLADVAAGLEQRGAGPAPASLSLLAVLQELARVDPDAAAQPAERLVERALGDGDDALAGQAEAILLGAGSHSSPTVLLRLGDVHVRHGDTAGAATLFRRAAADQPGDTRATARLAALFRLAGAADDEDQALRDIVLRAADADELDAAGQRLLTVALARGRCADLVRWLDAVAPHHPHRDILERFRISAYDTWLRGAALDRALGETGPAPSPSPMADALGSGDLAMQVRALRQLSQLHRPLPAAVARQLLRSPNPVLRRDTALALGASHSEGASLLLVEALGDGQDSEDEVLRAQLVALSQLPAVAGEEPVLVSLLGRQEGALAAWILGRMGAETALDELVKATRSGRRETQFAAVMALGTLMGRMHHVPRVASMWPVLLETGPMMPGADTARRAVQFWSLAASGVPAARAELTRQALTTRSGSLRVLALRLLAAQGPPQLPTLSAEPGDAEATRDLRSRLVRQAVAGWMMVEVEELRQVVRQLDTELDAGLSDASARGAWSQDAAAGWCDAWEDLLSKGTMLHARCATRDGLAHPASLAPPLP